MSGIEETKAATAAGGRADSIPHQQPCERGLGDGREATRDANVPDWRKRLDVAKKSRGNVIWTNSHDPNPSYEVGRKLGEGAFGVTFEGVKLANRNLVAIKFELRRSKLPQSRDEYRAYKALAGCEGIPRVHFYGDQNLHTILILDLLGPSLGDLFNRSGGKFTAKTVAMLGKQLLSRLKAVHGEGWIHGDIKPENILIPTAERGSQTIHLIDFGMAKLYRDPQSKQHIPYRDNMLLTGTARYMSINTHLGKQQSRRDDLEATYHTLLYFLKGRLPWQGVTAATNKQKFERIGEKKQTTTMEDLCEGCLEEFGKSLRYIRGLEFDETPNYDFLDSLLLQVLHKGKEIDDGEYDWKHEKG